MRDRLLDAGGLGAHGHGRRRSASRSSLRLAARCSEFRTLLFSKIVPNVKRLGLLTPRVRERFAELGILQFEHLDASA